jgi:alanine racemase
MRPSWIEIDLQAIEDNARVIATAIAPAELCAVVKADAYGHGDIPVADAVGRGGATWLAVALVEEGVRLREADVDLPILLLSEPRHEDAAAIVEYGLTPTAYRLEFVERLAQEATSATSLPYPVHLKLDTGMHRVGAEPTNALAIAKAIDADHSLELQGVYTHFAVADEDAGYTLEQNGRLETFVAQLESEGIRPKLLHAANTAAALDIADTRHQMCRIGLGIYGLRPSPHSGTGLDLKPAMRVVSHVEYVREVPAEARPSYGRIRELDGVRSVATVPIGYADGVRRAMSDNGQVLINGTRYPYAGTVTMDMVIVDVGNDEVSRGDEVVLLGRQGSDEIPAEEWAEELGTISYEIVCGFASRIPRRFLEMD